MVGHHDSPMEVAPLKLVLQPFHTGQVTLHSGLGMQEGRIEYLPLKVFAGSAIMLDLAVVGHPPVGLMNGCLPAR